MHSSCKRFIFHQTCIILITIITSTVLIIYILFNHQYDGNLDNQTEVNKIEIINTKTEHISLFFAEHNENIRNFGVTPIKSTANAQTQNSVVAQKRIKLRKLRRQTYSSDTPEKHIRTIIKQTINNRKKPIHNISTVDEWRLTFNNTWFIKDNISMYEDHSEILDPTHLNFTILKQRYNTFISSLKPLKNINGIIDDINPNQTRCKHKGKVFAIGINKSGTTSLNAALNLLGYSHNGSFSYWFKKFKTFNPERFNGAYFYFRHFYDKLNVIFMNKYLVDLLSYESFHSYNFGDSPYCFLYEMMDKLYPNSKFILMRRQSTWTIVNSNMKYASNYGANAVCQFYRYYYRRMPAPDFANWLAMRYELHNERVIEYFNKSNRINKDLLILDMETIIKQNTYTIGQQKVWKMIMEFLGCDDNDEFSIQTSFPHKNAAKVKSCDILPEMYDLDWRKYFNYQIPIMYQDPPQKYGELRQTKIRQRTRNKRRWGRMKNVPMNLDVKLIMLNESIDNLL
eukprot:526783_1